MIIIECIIICVLMWIICYLGTGTEEKNLKNFESYPKEIKNKILKEEKYKNRIKVKNKLLNFIINLIIFSAILFVFGIFIKTQNFKTNFLNILIIGEVLNLFDLIIIDLIWWRNTKRIRFKKWPNKELYKNPKEHILSFIRAFFMYLIIAIIDGYILTLI